MEPETYQQAVSESTSEAARVLALFIREAAVTVGVAICLGIVLWSRHFIHGNLHRFLASNVATQFRWLSPQPLLTYSLSGVTLAAGVYLAVFSLDGERWRRSRRFWQRTPEQIVDWFEADGETPQREDLFAGHDRDAYDQAVTIAKADRRKQNRRQTKAASRMRKNKH